MAKRSKSKKQSLKCPGCGRSDFRTSSGLSTHMRYCTEFQEAQEQSPLEEMDDAIAGQMEEEVVVKAAPVIGEEEVKADETMAYGVLMQRLCVTIFHTARSLLTQIPVQDPSLLHFQRCAVHGAYLLTGQALGQSDAMGAISVSRAIPTNVVGIDPIIKKGNPVLPEPIVDGAKSISIEAPGGFDPQAEIDLSVVGVDPLVAMEVQSRDTPDLATFLMAMWVELKRLRTDMEWMRRINDQPRKVLQGVQVTTAQLLGLQDKHGPITLARLMKSGIGNPRVFNALGYRTPLNTGSRATIPAPQPSV